MQDHHTWHTVTSAALCLLCKARHCMPPVTKQRHVIETMSDQQFLYFAKRPPLKELEAVELVYRAANTTVPLLRMKCRELARADGNCVVTPVHGINDNTAWAVAKIGYFRECGTQQKLLQLGFEVTSRNHVTIETLQRCYEFSVTARMGPKWNRIDEHLVQGCEFFSTGKTYHVGVDINITATELVVALKAGQIKFSFLKPEDLNATASLLQQYKSGVTRVMTETSFEDRGCILLPNCTRGAVYSVSPTVPASQQFSTYNSIRIHWKKHHGFVLPDQQSIFYQIYFTFRANQLLSYPGCCVLQYPPITYKCKDPAAICASFVDCLHSRIPSLCGYPIHYTTQPLQPSVGLSSALHCQKFVNLLHVGKKPASTGTLTDFSSIANNCASTSSAVKPDHAYKPIFHSSLVSRRNLDERRPGVNHAASQLEPPQRLLPAPFAASSRQAAELASSVSNTVPIGTAASSCLHKDNSSDTRMLHDVTNKASSLIAQISRQKVATLTKWLVIKNVKFRAKGTKKDDLIRLVAMHIKDVKELLVMSSEE